MEALTNMAPDPLIRNQRTSAAGGAGRSVRMGVASAAQGAGRGYPRNRVSLTVHVSPVRFFAFQRNEASEGKENMAPTFRGRGGAPMSKFLTGEKARAAIVLWASGQFDTAEIAKALDVSEDAAWRTLHLAKDGARADARAQGLAEVIPS